MNEITGWGIITGTHVVTKRGKVHSFCAVRSYALKGANIDREFYMTNPGEELKVGDMVEIKINKVGREGEGEERKAG